MPCLPQSLGTIVLESYIVVSAPSTRSRSSFTEVKSLTRKLNFIPQSQNCHDVESTYRCSLKHSLRERLADGPMLRNFQLYMID